MDPHFQGVIFQTHAAELARRLGRPRPPCAVLDVRPAAEYAAGHIPGARAAAAGALPAGLDLRHEIVVVGRGPGDPAVRHASEALQAQGARRRVELTGGMDEWRRLGLPLASGRDAAGPGTERAA